MRTDKQTTFLKSSESEPIGRASLATEQVYLPEESDLSKEVISLKINHTRHALMSQDIKEKQDQFDYRLSKLENKHAEISDTLGQQIGKYLHQAKTYSDPILREQFFVHARSTAKRYWEMQASPTGYTAQGSLLILYCLSNNPSEKISSSILDTLIDIANNLAKMTPAKKKYYTQMIYEAGLTLSGHSSQFSENK